MASWSSALHREQEDDSCVPKETQKPPDSARLRESDYGADSRALWIANRGSERGRLNLSRSQRELMKTTEKMPHSLLSPPKPFLNTV